MCSAYPIHGAHCRNNDQGNEQIEGAVGIAANDRGGRRQPTNSEVGENLDRNAVLNPGGLDTQRRSTQKVPRRTRYPPRSRLADKYDAAQEPGEVADAGEHYTEGSSTSTRPSVNCRRGV